MSTTMLQQPPTMAGDAAVPQCVASYAALYDGCRDEHLGRRTATQQVSEIARLVTDYALCARAARLPATAVLAALRDALAPVMGRLPVPELIGRAIDDYYQARPSLE